MFHLLDASIEAFLRAEADLRPGDVDVSFDAPDRDWAAAISGPTVNLFLWDVRQHPSETSAGSELIERNGARFRRGPLPRVRLGYVATVWAADPRGEHQLLGAVLRALLAVHEIPARFLEGPLAGVRPLPAIEVGKPDDDGRADMWSALGGSFRPGIDMSVTVTVDPLAERPVPEPPDTVDIGVVDRREPARESRRRRVAGTVADPAAVGAGVRSPRGRGRVEEDGRFVVPAEPGDEVVVETDPPLRAVVPEDGPVEPSLPEGV